MCKDKIVLTMTEEGNIIEGALNEILPSDIIITEEDINSFVKIEMDEGSHSDFIEDYNTTLDFYLSNVEKDSYIDYIKEGIDDKKINNSLAHEIRELIIRQIKEKAEQ